MSAHKCWLWPVLLAAAMQVAQGQNEPTWVYSVQVSATIESSPPSIHLSWPQDSVTLPDFYTVSRKSPESAQWGPAVILDRFSTDFIDSNVSLGVAYEYQVYKSTYDHVGYGYISAGIQLPLIDNRGKIILLVDQTFAPQLAAELSRLQQDMVGDGWTVLRHDVARDASVSAVKALVKAEYESDPLNVKALFLFGHIPVPYSGDFAADGHFSEHTGAWPADTYYGDLNGVWTDNVINDTSALFPKNLNVPGDGKYDQSEIPGVVLLQLGRVDLADMPGLDPAGVPSFPSEAELLRRYLNKDHNYRHRVFSLPSRGLVFNVTGDRAGEAFAADAWRNYAPLLGPPPAAPIGMDQFLPVLHSNGYQWAYATCGSGPNMMFALGGIMPGPDWGNAHWGGTFDFVQTDIQSSFVMLLGSWIGDWAMEDNLMRSVLATPTFGLSCVYAGRPHWYFHPLGIGETLGYCARLTQNNHADGLYRNQSNNFAGFVHTALLGDPTLRLHTVAPPANLHAIREPKSVQLSWTASADSVAGYHVYRASNASGPFLRLTTSPVTSTSFLDSIDTPEACTYMVRAIKLQTSPSGSYFNASQGIFTDAGPPPPELYVSPSSNVMLTIRSTPGATYRILWCDSLANPTWNALPLDMLATASLLTCSISPSGQLTGSGWVSTNATVAGNVVLWLDDSLPSGAAPGPDSDPWNWVNDNPAPYSGSASVKSALKTGFHQQYFLFGSGSEIAVDDELVAAVYVDPDNRPSEIMVQWNDGLSWEHRAFWGDNLVTYGENGTPARFYAGPLPSAGRWSLLRVAARDVGLAGAKVCGLALSLYDGVATWDFVGKNGVAKSAPNVPSPTRFFKVLMLP